MLTGGITERRDIPHEDGEWMTIRLLGWQQLEQARDARAKKGLANVREMGHEVYAAIQTATRQQQANGNGAEPADREIDDTYDRATLLKLGIAAWSYDAPVTPETIGQLDEKTAHWAMGSILGILFQRSGEDRKNVDTLSTPT